MTFPPNSCKMSSYWILTYVFLHFGNSGLSSMWSKSRPLSHTLHSAYHSSLSHARTLDGGRREVQGSPFSSRVTILSLPLEAYGENRYEASQFHFFKILTEQMETCLLTLFILFPPFYRCSFFLFTCPVLSLELFYLPNTKYWIYLPKLGKRGSMADSEKIVCSFFSERDPPGSTHSLCYPSHTRECSNCWSGAGGLSW